MLSLLSLFEPPARLHVPQVNYKDFVVVALSSTIGFVVHVLFLLFFIFVELHFMAYFNIASIAIFVFSFFANRYSVGKWTILVNFFCLEVVVHAIFAVLFLGWGSNFQLYLFAPILCTFLVSQGNLLSKSSLFFTVLSLFSYIFLAIYSHYYPPLQSISALALNSISVVNIFNSVLVVTVITLYFNYTANKSIQEVAEKNEALKTNGEKLMWYNEELTQQANTLLLQAQQLNIANKNMSDSIQYAYRIQQAILPSLPDLNQLFGEEHVVELYIPKDIVSGDFFWCKEKNNVKVIAVADCTGHGVPGSMLTLIGSSLLNNIVAEKGITEPSLILENLQTYFATLFSNSHSLRDGMDISVICIDHVAKKCYFSGAHRPLTYIQNGVMQTIKGSKIGIGNSTIKSKVLHPFTTHEIDISIPTMLYIYTDGYEDQFGSWENRKFYSKNLRELLLNIHAKPVAEQSEQLKRTFEDWCKGHKQTDDVTLVGVRVA